MGSTFRHEWGADAKYRAKMPGADVRIIESIGMIDLREWCVTCTRAIESRAPTGDQVTTWLRMLHFGNVSGVPYGIFVLPMGLAIALLSLTGAIIWLKKTPHPIKIYTSS